MQLCDPWTANQVWLLLFLCEQNGPKLWLSVAGHKQRIQDWLLSVSLWDKTLQVLYGNWVVMGGSGGYCVTVYQYEQFVTLRGHLSPVFAGNLPNTTKCCGKTKGTSSQN